MAVPQGSLIRFLTYRLPFELSNQIFNEYETRMKEIVWYLEHARRFAILKNEIKSIELLLAVSIFHKRVISNLDSAANFFDRVTKASEAETVKIGSYNMTGKGKNKILSVVINFNRI